MQKMLNLGFRNFRHNFYFFQLQYFFCAYDYLFELIFALLTFRDKGVIVIVGPFLRLNILWCAQNFQWAKNSVFSKWKTYFSQFIDKFLQFEEMKYLIHHSKFETWLVLRKFPILFLKAIRLDQDITFPNSSTAIQNSDFGILVLGSTSKLLGCPSKFQLDFSIFLSLKKRLKIGIFEY